MHSLRAPEPPIILPGVLDDHSSLHLPQHSLGSACRVGKHLGSLQKESSRAQKQAVSFPVLDRSAPASKGKSLRRSLSEPTFPQHFALEERTRQKLQQHDPPPTQLRHVVSQLRAELCILQHVVRQLAELQSVACSKTRDNIEETSAHNQNNNNNNNNTNNTNNTNNNNNNDNNDNDNNKNIQESGLGSVDLDDDNPESSLSGSEPDLDESSLASFDPKGDEASSLDNLGYKTMTLASSLGSLDQQEQDDQEGMTIETAAWDPSLDPSRAKPKKRVTFSKTTLAAYNKHRQNNRQQQNKGSRPRSSQLEQLEHKEKNNKETRIAWKMSFQKRIAGAKLPKLAGMSPSKSKRRCSNSLQQLWSRRWSIGNAQTTAWIEKSNP